MKLRHVRAVAICGIAVVALTGARGSHGGSCDNSSSSSGSSGGSSSSSSSSSSSGGSSYDDDDSTSGGSSTTGDTTSSGTTGSVSGSSGNKGANDVRIDSCTYDSARGIVAAVSAKNSSASETYSYSFTVSFTDPTGTTLGERSPSIPMVLAGQTDTLDVATPYVPQEGATSGGKCTLKNVKRTVS
ncbi:hypothetical protein ABCR94_00925 [Streptomyces sp. 21So2-11]|uniref:hypothetical protein n=1 Tax=Streptomyces sp. 21So2-11 TaxID=3144408 RepID=UPI00321BA4DE